MRTAMSFAILLVTTIAAPAAAQTRDQNVTWCTSRDSTADLRIGGCTALIQAGKETASDLAIIFADRGLGYFDKTDYLKAKDDFDQSLRLNASGALAIGGRARVMAIQQQFDAAISEHTRAIGLMTAGEAYFQYWLRGMTYLDAKQYPEALRDFTQAIAMKADYGQAFFQRGRVYFAQGDYAKAIADNTASLRLDATEYIAYYNRGLAYAKTSETDKAIADFDALLKTDPTYIDGWVERGHVHMSKAAYPNALADFNQALKLKPDNQEAVFSRARVYYSQGSYDLCIADNTTAIALDPTDYVAYSNRGLAYKAQGDYAKALADFDKALTMHPSYAAAMLDRARTYFSMTQYDKSIDEFKRVISANPKDGNAFYYRSLVYVASDRLELALADIQTALSLQPDDTADLTERAEIYQRLHLFQLADSDYAAIMKIDPKRTYTASLKALNRSMLNQDTEAVVDCNALLAATPESHGINETCGMVYLKAGDATRALSAFEKALPTAGATDGQPLYGRGLAKVKLGRAVAAKADLDKAITIDANIAAYFARFGLVR